MYLAIFNSLLVLGIVGSMSSEAMIYQEMMDNYLATYYKETASKITELQKKEFSKVDTN